MGGLGVNGFYVIFIRFSLSVFPPPACSLNYSGVCLASDTQFSDFLDGMGPAQFVGRQTLATTSMGKHHPQLSPFIRASPRCSGALGEMCFLKKTTILNLFRIKRL